MNTIDAARRALAHIAHLIKMVSRAEVAGQTVDNLPTGLLPVARLRNPVREHTIYVLSEEI